MTEFEFNKNKVIRPAAMMYQIFAG